MNKKLFGTALMGVLLSAGTFVSCQDYDDEIDDLQGQITSLKSDVEGLKSQIQAGAVITGVNSTANGVTVTLSNGQSFNLTNGKDGANGSNGKDGVDGKDGKAGSVVEIGANGNWVIDGVDTGLAAQGPAGKDGADGKDGKDGVDGVDGKDGVNGTNGANGKDGAYYEPSTETGTFFKVTADGAKTDTGISWKKSGVTAVFDTVTGNLTLTGVEGGDVVISLSGRPTSLVFAPSRYINGIEAIVFENYKYKDWTNTPAAWLADAPVATNADKVVDKEGATAKYVVSPLNTTVDAFESLSFLYNDAKNTRAAGEGFLTVASKKIENGKLVLGLKKDATVLPAIGTDAGEDVKIVALKAVLSDKVKTAAEANQEVALVSDWARVQEKTTTLRIANSLLRDADNKHISNKVGAGRFSFSTGRLYDNQENSHFWNFTTIYSLTERLDGIYTYPTYTYHVAAEVCYKDTVDLLKMVTVCNEAEEALDNYKDLGLKFEFHTLKYICDNHGYDAITAQDETDQNKFAKLLADGHNMISTARNGAEKNADAVGRTPVVQAVLKDTVNNAVVDVRYFKIIWTATAPVPPTTTVAPLDPVNPVAYSCADAYEAWLGEEYMNNLYASVGESGLSKTEFHTAFPLSSTGTTVYAIPAGKTIDDAKAAVVSGTIDPAVYTAIGAAYDATDYSDVTQTHNLKVAFGGVNPTAEATYDINGFFVLTSTSRNENIIVPIKLTVKAGVFGYKYNYFESQWNKEDGTIYTSQPTTSEINKYRNVNPTLWSDPVYGNTVVGTTQLRGSLAFGYIKNGSAPTSLSQLLQYTPAVPANAAAVAATSDIVFDKDRLSMLPDYVANAAANTNWNIVDAGKTLRFGLVVAAKIVDKDVYLVDNNSTLISDGAATAQPTTAALKLVGKKVPVKVTAENCNISNFDKYLCYFIEPLKFVGTDGQIELIDVMNGADSQPIGIANIIKLQENFGQNHAQIAIFGAARAAAANDVLIKWYEVEDVVVDLAGAKTTLNVNGGQDATCATLLSAIKNQNGDQSYVINYDAVNDKLSFHNASGNAIAAGYSFLVEVPVKIDTKWQKGMTANIKIKVKSGI